jgi:heat shock protein HslJ
MTRRALPRLALAAGAVLAACATGAAQSASNGALDGHTYLSTGIEGATLVPGTQVRLTFTDGNLNASGGCNIMGGRYSIEGDQLATSQMSMTEMACDDARQRQDDWLARFLGGVTVALDGDTLTLADGTVHLTLLDKEVATPDQPLEGTSWVLDGIVTGDAVSSVPAGVTAAIQIASGRVAINAGCNTGGGNVSVTPDTITFGPIGLTKMACGPDAMAVETAITTGLSGAVTYAIDADVLTLTADDHGLVFRAASCPHCRP